MSHVIHWQPQLSALALLDAQRVGSYTNVASVLRDTPPMELHVGLVQLATALIGQIAHDKRISAAEVIDMYRKGMWAMAVSDE